jgi:hypothetical protein
MSALLDAYRPYYQALRGRLVAAGVRMFSSTSATCVNDLLSAEADADGTKYRVSTRIWSPYYYSHLLLSAC